MAKMAETTLRTPNKVPNREPMLRQLQSAAGAKTGKLNSESGWARAQSAAAAKDELGKKLLSNPIKKSGSGPSSHSNTTHAPVKTSGSVNPAGGPKKASPGKPNTNYAKSTRTLIADKH